jgi:hypothetical protein
MFFYEYLKQKNVKKHDFLMFFWFSGLVWSGLVTWSDAPLTNQPTNQPKPGLVWFGQISASLVLIDD